MTSRRVVSTLDDIVELRERRLAGASAALGAAREHHATITAALERRDRRIADVSAAHAALSRGLSLGQVPPALLETALVRLTALADARDREIENRDAELAAKRQAEADCLAAEAALRRARGRLEAVTQWRAGFVKDRRTAIERRAERDEPIGRAAAVIGSDPWI